VRYEFREFENRVLKKIFGTKEKKQAGANCVMGGFTANIFIEYY
jgi:hypothetical protein